MMALHQSMHASSGVCLWTLLSFVVLGVMVVIAGVHTYKQKKRDDDFRKDLEDSAAVAGAAGE